MTPASRRRHRAKRATRGVTVATATDAVVKLSLRCRYAVVMLSLRYWKSAFAPNQSLVLYLYACRLDLTRASQLLGTCSLLLPNGSGLRASRATTESSIVMLSLKV